MNEKGQLILPHVFWEGFSGQRAAFSFLRQQGLTFSGRNYDAALRELLERYGAERLGSAVAEHIKRRLHPDDLNELWLQYWAEELPALDAIQKADPEGYRSWVDVEVRFDRRNDSVKNWARFAHFYFQYLGDKPPSGSKRPIEE